MYTEKDCEPCDGSQCLIDRVVVLRQEEKSGQIFLQLFLEQFHGPGKTLGFFPHQIHAQLQPGVERTKAEVTACGVHQLVQGKGVAIPSATIKEAL